MRGNLPVPPSPPPPVIGQGLTNDRDRESGILAPRPAERLVGNGDLRRDRGDAVRDDHRHLLLPPLQQRPLAPAGGTGAQADAASRPRRNRHPAQPLAPAPDGDRADELPPERPAGDHVLLALRQHPRSLRPRHAALAAGMRRDLNVNAEFLQWFGLLGAALTWTLQLVIGFGVTIARCGAANAVLGVDLKAWEVTLLVAGIVFALLAEGAALTLLWQTPAGDYTEAPPDGRRHFFVVAAALGNLLFLVVIVLSGVGAIVHTPCVPA